MSSHADREDLQPASFARGGLPAEITPFIGRREELDELQALLTDPETRLVTILGAGGMGKTRIARELALALQAKFRDGVRFVSLAQSSTADHLIHALAAALDIRLSLGGDLQQAILEELDSKHLLLVLDNFEHLVKEALLVRDILSAALQIKILITSREKLNLQGEVLYRLRGLQLPPRAELETIETYDAVHLFMQRARQAQPGFVMSDQDLLPVVRICRLVDGMPLGILMAAAWIEHFSPQAIADQIGRDLDFLSNEMRDVPSRHRSLRTVFNSSFEYLDEEQRSVFRRLAVFRDGFTLEAAEAVAGADMKTLLALVEKSLLQRDRYVGRFDLHDLLRQFAGEKLNEAGEGETVAALHAGYYLEFIQRLAPRLKSADQAQALDAIQADFENISQAWAWAVEHRDFKAIESATPGLYAFCDMRSRYDEGEALFDLARRELSLPSGGAPCSTVAPVLLSWYDLIPDSERPGVFEELTPQAEDCLRQARAEGHAEGTASSLVVLGAIAGDRQDLKIAIDHFQEAVQLSPSLDDFYWVKMRVGLCYQSLGQHAAATRSFRESLRRGQALGERAKMGWSLANLGDTLSMAGERAEARKCLEEALDLFEELGTSGGILWSIHSLANLAIADGDPELARTLTGKAMEIARQTHASSWIGKLSDLIQQMEVPPPGSQPLSEPLSERELEVLRYLKTDLDGPEIAGRLFVTLNTLRYHTKNIYRKLQVKSRREAVRRAEELRL